MAEANSLTYTSILEPKLLKSSTKLCKNEQNLSEIMTGNCIQFNG